VKLSIQTDLALIEAYDQRIGELELYLLRHAKIDDGNTYSLASDVSLGLAATSAGLAVWFFLTEGRGDSQGTFAPTVVPGGAGVTGTF
jgi:hypothetical protein